MQILYIFCGDNKVRLFIILIIIVLHLSALEITAQEWIEPINITNLGGYYIKSPDMVLDKKGTIHIVYVYKIIANYALIMYTYSENDGLTWAEPFDLLQNSDYLMEQPHITCDSNNKLYVTYTHDYLGWTTEGRVIKMLIFNDNLWSEPFIISEGMPGSHYSYVFTDNTDRIYVFWDYAPTGDDYYRYLENGLWSVPFCPYPGNDEIYAMVEAKINSNNSIYWIGSSLATNYYGERLKYFVFDYPNYIWLSPETPTNDTINVGLDIDLNGLEQPEIVYRKRISSPQSGTDLTAYTYKENGFWSGPEDVSVLPGLQFYQQIAIDQFEKPHIVEVYQNDAGYGIAHFEKSNSNWIFNFIDNTFVIKFPKLLFENNKLYLVYSKGWYESENFVTDLFFTKYDILTHIPEVKHAPTALQLFPNPARHSVTIAFELEQQQHVTVSVLDIAGKPIKQIANQSLPSGAHSFVWHGTDQSGRPVKSGTYLVQLQTQQGSATQAVEIAR